VIKNATVLISVVLLALAVNSAAGLSDTTDDGTGTISANGQNLPNEGMAKAFDNNTATKWLDFSPTYSWIQYRYAADKRSVVTEYTLTSANDAQERDPNNWNILGSNNGGASWVTLDTRAGELFTSRFQKRSFQFTNSTGYNIYRLQITGVRNGTTANSVQLAEIELIGTTPQPPAKATSPNPVNSATDVSTTATLSWTAGSGAASHDVYFGTSLSDVNSANRLLADLNGNGIVDWSDVSRLTEYWLLDPAGSEPYAGVDDDNIVDFFDYALLSQDWMNTAGPVFKGNRDANSFAPGTLALSTTYYWRIDEVNGPNTVKGDVWSFTTQSGKASSASPTDNASNVVLDVNLSWSAGAGAASHDVYFGTDSTPDETEFQGNQPGTTFDPCALLSPSTTYYWRIDEVNGPCTVTGDVWSFTTTDSNYSLIGKIMCGYQGWFNTPTDGAGRGWVHWGPGSFSPTSCTVDMWPDMNEMGASEKFLAIAFDEGSNHFYVFSPYKRDTVLRHFQWMQQYGIDGVYLQRFGTEVTPGSAEFLDRNAVLSHCRDGANMYGRKYAVMYDLSGLGAGGLTKVIDDWKYLVGTMHIGRDPNDHGYMFHNGKPVVSVWGLGFSRAYEGQESYNLINFLKNDPCYGGCTVMIGVDNDWQTSVELRTLLLADIISPWTVGRYGFGSSISWITSHGVPEKTWCTTNGKDYLPVIWPGYSFHNADAGKPLNEIPRYGGQFLWDQVKTNISTVGANMLYLAMFDEVDEGTAIFKITNDPPRPGGVDMFVTYNMDGFTLPSDEYLWLVGQACRALRGEITVTPTRPAR